jgi:Cu/Ag efflux pump CusA
MLHKPLAWAREHALSASLLIAGIALLTAVGMYALLTTPDHPDGQSPPIAQPPVKTQPPGPASADPVVIVVEARWPGASAEEMVRQVTVPLEVALAGTSCLHTTFSRSYHGLAHLDLHFEGTDADKARQEVINRLTLMNQALPTGVTPALVPARQLTVEGLRYTLSSPKNALGQDIYTSSDVRALQDYVLEREFARLPGVVMIVSAGGAVKRYEVQPDPERLKRYGITLQRLRTALADSNANVGGGLLAQGQKVQMVQGIGVIGGGRDPMDVAFGMKTPEEAAQFLRAEEQKRLREIRSIVITSINNAPVRIDDVVVGGPLPHEGAPSKQGVIVSHDTPLARVSLDRAIDPDGKEWTKEDDTIQGIVLVRKDADVAAVTARVLAKVKELNAGGFLLPGVKIEPCPVAGFFIHGYLPAGINLDGAVTPVRTARQLVGKFAEVAMILSEIDASAGGDPGPVESAELCVMLKSPKQWPVVPALSRPHHLSELMDDIGTKLEESLPGTTWICSPDSAAALGSCSPAKGELVVKLFGPELAKLQELAGKVRQRLAPLGGVSKVRVFAGQGAGNFEFAIDKEKCNRWGVQVADVINMINAGLGGLAVTQMIEGEKTYDIKLRWPGVKGQDASSLLELPVDLGINALVPGDPQSTIIGPKNAFMPHVRLKDLVSPLDESGLPNPKGSFFKPGVSVIYREQGQQLVVVKFRVQGRAEAEVQAEAQRAIADLFQPPYRAEWQRHQ